MRAFLIEKAIVVLALVLVPGLARAQETVGSFGGGSSSSSGSTSTGGSQGGGGGTRYGGSSSSTSSADLPPGDEEEAPQPVNPVRIMKYGLAAGVIVILFLAAQLRRRPEPLAPVVPLSYADPRLVSDLAPVDVTDVSAISLGIDAQARRFVQAALMKLAKSGDTRSKAGLSTLLRETVRTLRSVDSAWLYAGVRNADPTPSSDGRTQRSFESAVGDARARFKREVVPSSDGHTVEQDAGALRAKPTEGEGVVVVTLVVASRAELADVTNVRDGEALRALLERIASLTADELVAMEVVWSPAAEDDRMSTFELETIYPDLEKLDPAAQVGRVYCAHCDGPFPRELGTCPHCGAPA